MKKVIIASTSATIVFLFLCCGAFSILSPSLAQKKYVSQWEYAAINFTSISYSSENQAVITGVANVCYVQTNGCRNEEVNAELIYSKFLQDFRLENTSYSKNLALSRARELAFSKAVAKLGLEGWELIGQPSINFDSYILNNQSTYMIEQANKEAKPNVYFKRLIQ
ncbi:MAG: hypothetical protein M3033_10020 [Acidobacteriota bacterium]|nr:hypothetical protein [Acidobacteriota bacterium]